MNDIIFTNSFVFNRYQFDRFKYTDNREGISVHYFGYMVSGNCKIVADKEILKIQENDIFYIPNGYKYQSFWYGTPKISFISLGFLFLPNFNKTDYPVQVLQKNDIAVNLIEILSQRKQLDCKDIGLFYTLTGILLPNMKSCPISKNKKIVQSATNILMEDPYLKTSLIAQKCAISEAGLYSAFRKASDCSLNGLRQQIKLEKAKNILTTTDTSIEELSQKLGFSSSTYFRIIFKKNYNMTPREMRKQYQV